MTESLNDRRRSYEQAVRNLRTVADDMLSEGITEESVARIPVTMRNCLKKMTRADDPPILVRYMEQLNMRRYGDPLGPTADDQFTRYGSWALVIDAACRPAKISR